MENEETLPQPEPYGPEHFTAPPELVLRVLNADSMNNPLLKAMLDAAHWRAAALVERSKNNPPPEVPSTE